MMRFLAGCGVGIFAGYLLGFVIPLQVFMIPLQVFMIACLVLLALVVLLLYLFHLGIQDFQGY